MILIDQQISVTFTESRKGVNDVSEPNVELDVTLSSLSSTAGRTLKGVIRV